MKLETFIWYIDELKADIEAGKPVTIQIIDRDIFEAKTVKAIIAKSPEELPDGVDLWIKDDREELSPVPWRIKILEEINDLFTRPDRGLHIG